ncbi:porin [Emticicia agri]|uniref:porin n=1 Tax=Emticicia agri TaxID=2492393 RepID=UPI001E47433C|nr:porin [Emticicia agri]
MMNLVLNLSKRTVIGSFLICCTLSVSFAQDHGALTDIDTTTARKLFATLKKYEFVGISGYIQPQFQWIQTKGAKNFNGGDFQPNASNRFMLRRGRIRFDYARYFENNMPKLYFIFQFDGTERGIFIRDFWGRIYENKFKSFYLTTGMFARPFGFELGYGSPDRESPERGRMSQILMKVERDFGFMGSYEPRAKTNFLKYIKFDLAVFNGQGVNAVADFDNHKDVVSRLSVKHFNLAPKLIVSGSVSGFVGGMEQFTNKIYRMNESTRQFLVDSSASNVGRIAPRNYYGADIQIRIPNRVGETEFRAEYIRGTQTALQGTTETPAVIPMENGKLAPLYIRHFDGAYFYYLQHLGSRKHQLILKYDWYDPNKKVKGTQIGQGFSAADVRFNTFGFGYLTYIYDNVRLMLWYEMPQNEQTALTDYTKDLKDNNFTCRVQYRF